MDNQQVKIRIGLVCVAFLAATVVLVMLFGGGKMPRWFSSDYEIFVILPQVPMLSENSPVYKNGVEIGRVTRIQLVDEDRNVEITTRVNGAIKLYTNEECRLSLNLLGQSSLNFTPKPDVPLGEVINKGDRIEGVAPIDLLQMADTMQSDASKALQNISAAAEQMTASFNKINQMIGSPEEVARKQERLERMVDRADVMMISVNRVLGSVDELISDPEVKAGIKASSTQLPGIIDEGKALMANVNRLSAQFSSLMQRVDGTITKVDGNLDNLTAFTESLGSDGTLFLERLSSVAKEFEVVASQLSDFTRALNNPDSSIGQLLNDPEFFRSINSAVQNADRTIKNIERMTVQLQPILKDVNVFSDKIAREPGLLGLKGMLDKSPPTKGIPDAYAGPWGMQNNGIPQQQTERIQWQRTPRSKLLPFGAQHYRNEPVPRQNRFASQVIDLPDEPYSEPGEFGQYGKHWEHYDTAPMSGNAASPTEMQAKPVYIIPSTLAPMPPAKYGGLRPNGSQTNPQAIPQAAPQLVGPLTVAATTASLAKHDDIDLEIDFDTDVSHDPQTQQPSQLRLATGSVTTSQDSRIVPASLMVPTQQKPTSKTTIPSFSPTF